MKLLLFLLTTLFTFTALEAQPLPPAQIKIHKEMFRQIKQETQEQTPFQQALQQLAERQNPKNWKRISWQEFLKQNEHAKSREGVCMRLDLQCLQNLCNTCPEPLPFEVMFDSIQQTADYKELLKDEKLIYIMEGNNHNTKAAPLEVAEIMRAVREANPQAKILLAAEFLNWESLYNVLGTADINKDLSFKYNQYQEYYQYLQCDLPEPQNQQQCNNIAQYLQLLEQEINNPTLLLKKAGAKSGLDTSAAYAVVFQTADELGIDQLALDDNLYGEDNKNNIGVKVGEYVIFATPSDDIPSWKALKNQLGENAKLGAMSQLISLSSWGVLERNREWARRIRALLPVYDIVLVYAGAGHLNQAYSIDLQPLVGKKDFANIALYPLEELPQELKSYYQQRHDIAERRGFSRDEQNWQQAEEFDIYENKLWGNPQTNLELDLTKPTWFISREDKLNDFLNEHQQDYWPFLEESYQQENDFPFRATLEIQIYLPAK